MNVFRSCSGMAFFVINFNHLSQQEHTRSSHVGGCPSVRPTVRPSDRSIVLATVRLLVHLIVLLDRATVRLLVRATVRPRDRVFRKVGIK